MCLWLPQPVTQSTRSEVFPHQIKQKEEKKQFKNAPAEDHPLFAFTSFSCSCLDDLTPLNIHRTRSFSFSLLIHRELNSQWAERPTQASVSPLVFPLETPAAQSPSQDLYVLWSYDAPTSFICRCMKSNARNNLDRMEKRRWLPMKKEVGKIPFSP